MQSSIKYNYFATGVAVKRGIGRCADQSGRSCECLSQRCNNCFLCRSVSPRRQQPHAEPYLRTSREHVAVIAAHLQHTAYLSRRSDIDWLTNPPRTWHRADSCSNGKGVSTAMEDALSALPAFAIVLAPDTACCSARSCAAAVATTAALSSASASNPATICCSRAAAWAAPKPGHSASESDACHVSVISGRKLSAATAASCNELPT